MILVIDEWIWHELRGEYERKEREKAIRFLIKMIEKCDKLAVAHKSKFEEKLWKFLKQSDTENRMIVRILTHKILYNSDKYLEVQLRGRDINIECVNIDDKYLVNLCYQLIEDYSEKEVMFISTDRKLIECLKKESSKINCYTKEDFWKTILISFYKYSTFSKIKSLNLGLIPSFVIRFPLSPINSSR